MNKVQHALNGNTAMTTSGVDFLLADSLSAGNVVS